MGGTASLTLPRFLANSRPTPDPDLNACGTDLLPISRSCLSPATVLGASLTMCRPAPNIAYAVTCWRTSATWIHVSLVLASVQWKHVDKPQSPRSSQRHADAHSLRPQYGIDLPQFGGADMTVPTFRTLTTYSWEQSDMLVKIYVPLRGVQTDLLRCAN